MTVHPDNVVVVGAGLSGLSAATFREIINDGQVMSVDWAKVRPAYTAHLLQSVSFALAHSFTQTGPFRPAHTVRGIDNVEVH